MRSDAPGARPGAVQRRAAADDAVELGRFRRQPGGQAGQLVVGLAQQRGHVLRCDVERYEDGPNAGLLVRLDLFGGVEGLGEQHTDCLHGRGAEMSLPTTVGRRAGIASVAMSMLFESDRIRAPCRSAFASARPVPETHDDQARHSVMNRDSGRSGMSPRRAIWFAVGIAALALAALGAALPLLPTTPFLLIAAYAFARSSKRWHAWLHSHRVFGPLIRDWREHRAIHRRAKIVGVASMVAVLAISVAAEVDTVILAVQAVVLSASAAFVLSRPSPPDR